MEYRTLGRTDLSVSLLSMGTGGYGILGQRDGRPESEAHKLLFRAFELGINLFDTAPAYGGVHPKEEDTNYADGGTAQEADWRDVGRWVRR